MTTTLETPRRSTRSRPAIVEITFSKKPVRHEPELEIMDDMVEIVEAIVGLATPLAFPGRVYANASLTASEMEVVRQRKIIIIDKAVKLVEDRDDAQEALYALYVLAVFRFELTMKGLTDLTSRINRSGTHLSALCTNAHRSRDPRYRGSV